MASTLARERGAERSAFEAVADPMYASHPRERPLGARSALGEGQKQLAELGGVKPHVASGDAAQVLARYAASIDLLVVGSHEYRLRDRFSGGSTSQRLADSAACALLVLGPGSRDATRAR